MRSRTSSQLGVIPRVSIVLKESAISSHVIFSNEDLRQDLKIEPLAVVNYPLILRVLTTPTY